MFFHLPYFMDQITAAIIDQIRFFCKALLTKNAELHDSQDTTHLGFHFFR